MSETRNILFVGIGSPHGDDQIGWFIADRLAADVRCPEGIAFRMAAIPLDILDWLDGVDELHICDAFRGASPPGMLLRWNCRKTDVDLQFESASTGMEFSRLRSAGSHDFGIPAVLSLAAKLHRLPETTVIWGVAGREFETQSDMSAELERSLLTIVADIIDGMRHARSVTRAVAAETS